MKIFLVKFIAAFLLLALLAACGSNKAAPITIDKAPTNISSACPAPEPSGVAQHWVAYKNQNVAAMIATFDLQSPNAPTPPLLNQFFADQKANQITLDSVTWVATCPLSDGSTYSFFLVAEHNPMKSIVQWYVVTANSDGLIDNIE